MVSHDRDFLDAVTSSTCVLRDARSYRFARSFTSAMEELEAMDAAHTKTRAAEDRKIDALRASAKRLAQWGKVYDNEKLARRARSMERRVERLEEDRTFVTAGSPLELDLELETSRSRQALAIEALTVAVPGRVLYRVEQLVLRPGDRVALLGANGTGKSTLIRTLMAAYAEASASPQIRFSPQSRIGYYDQELDEVAGGEDMLSFTCRRVRAPEQQVRNRLISAGFPHTEHGKRVDALSGGERARLLFVVHALNSPNFLILDEPTNHIDIAGREQLESQLLSSGATLLITSHDRRFLTRVAERFLLITDDRLVELPSPEPFFLAAGAGGGETRSAPGAATGSGKAGDAGPAAQDPDVLLERIVELEDKLESDRRRKAKFQKPKLQAEWRRELDALYAALEERSDDA
jgi:ATPase subunit of ABC transporter with duplicated ATPase domains